MRFADGKPPAVALVAAGSIAQMVCNVDIGERTLVSTTKIADFDEVRVNRWRDIDLLYESRPTNQAC